jgi:hypothetical protein
MDSANGSDDDVASASASASTLPALARCLQRFQYTGDDSVVVVSYHGPADFLEDQKTFDAVLQNSRPFDPYWTDNPLVQQEMRAFATSCGMYAFLRTVCEDYVGTVHDLLFDEICAIGEKLRTYRMEYTVQGKVHTCTPVTLYSKYIAHIFLLPEDSREWGFTLHGMFSGSLTPKIRKGAHESKTYVRPNFTKLITHSYQCDALVLLKNKACLIWEAHKEQDERFRETWLELSGGNKNGSHGQAKPLQRNSNTSVNTVDTPYDDEGEQQQPGNLDRITSKKRKSQNHIRFDQPQAVGFHQGASAAEDTINNTKTGSNTNQGGGVYPTDPRSGRKSDFPLGFHGCMSCGNKNHRFSECKSRSEVAARQKFYANFNAHREHIANARLKRESEKKGSTGGKPVKIDITGLHYGPSREDRAKQELEQIKAARGHTQVSEKHALPSPCNNDHQPMHYRNCIYHASVLTGHAEKECHHMPIDFRNELPTLNLSLGSIDKGQATVKLNVLFDTCGAINTGFNHITTTSAVCTPQ